MKYLLIVIVTVFPLLSQSLEQQVRFQQVFDNIILPATSAPVPNIGQGSHTVSVFYPTAVANVLALQIRLEASFDNSVGSYFPISEDITQANFNGTFSYVIAKANGTFPFVRINALAVDPVLPADIWYTGSTFPIGAVVYEAPTTRYIIEDTSGTIAGVPVSTTLPLAGEILIYNAVTGQWEPGPIGGAGTNAVQLQGVNINAAVGAPAGGEFVYYDAVSGTYTTTPVPAGAGQILYWNGVTWVLTAAPGAPGDILTWNGAALGYAAGGGIGGGGVAGQSAYFTAGTTIAGDTNYTYDAVNDELHIGPTAGWPAQGVGFTWDGNLVTHNDSVGVPNFPGIVMVSAGNAYATAIEALHSRGTLAAPTVVVSGDTTLAQSYFNYDGTQFVLSAIINTYADGIISDVNNHVGGAISLGVADGTSAFGTPLSHLFIHGRHVTIGGIGQNDAVLDMHTSTLVTIAAWPNPVAGSTSWCNDCIQANPCAGGGTGALAIYANAQWNCQH